MLRITMNKPAVDEIGAGIERLAKAVNTLDEAVNTVDSAATTQAKVAKTSARTYRLWVAVAFSDLLRRLTGR